MYTLGTYSTYLVLSVLLSIWAGRTLFKNGRIFLVDSFQGNELLADSVNHLLVVGFYLVNIGFVSVALSCGDKPQDLEQSIEIVSTKVGFVMLVLGFMHFTNLLIFSEMRKRALIPPLLLNRKKARDPVDL